MLSTLLNRLRVSYLRWLLESAERDVLITELEMSSAPFRLGVYKKHAQGLRDRINELEAAHARRATAR